ncbi:hypothetical protein T06_11226 [Trichinella sp. T6]|nr:hypothetical protein T06_11226 [Trichinella sp. T6]
MPKVFESQTTVDYINPMVALSRKTIGIIAQSKMNRSGLQESKSLAPPRMMDLCCDCCGQSVVNRLDLVQAQWSTATQPRLGKQKTYSNWLMHLIVHWSLATWLTALICVWSSIEPIQTLLDR